MDDKIFVPLLANNLKWFTNNFFILFILFDVNYVKIEKFNHQIESI